MIELNRNGVKYNLDVDILSELDEFTWGRARVKGNEMVACSPFRDEKSPSFSINTDTGLWVDFGSHDYYSKGNIITLLAFLKNESYEEVELYLLSKYGIDLSDVDNLSVNIDFNINTNVNTDKIITMDEYSKYAYRHAYLTNRGITEKVQRAFKIGYDVERQAVAIAWHDVNGNIVNVKFRSIHSKQFFYFDGGQQLRNHVYGLHFVHKLDLKTVYIVESEIDALYLYSCGLPAIALGGSKISEARKQLILRSPIETLVIATDNDSVGRELGEKITKLFIGSKEIKRLPIPDNYKDVNEVPPELIKQLSEQLHDVSINLFNLK